MGNKTLQNVLYLYVQQFFTYFSPLLINFYLVRVLGEDVFGYYALSNTYYAYLLLIVDFGFNLSSTSDIAKAKKSISEIFSETITLRLFLFALTTPVYGALIFSFDKIEEYILYFSLNIVSLFVYCFNSYFLFLGSQDLKIFVLANTLNKIVLLIVIFLAINEPKDLILIQFISFTLSFLLTLYLFYFAYKKYSLRVFKLKFNFDALKLNFNLFISRISSLGTSNIYTLFISFIFPLKYVTVFYFIEKIISMSGKLLIPIYEAFYPKMSQKFDIKILTKILLLSFVVSVFLSTSLFLLANNISIIFFNTYNEIFINSLRIMSLSFPFTICYMVLGSNYLLANGYNYFFNLTSYLGFAFTLFGLMIIYLLNFNVYENFFIVISVVFVLIKVVQFLMRGVYFINKEWRNIF